MKRDKNNHRPPAAYPGVPPVRAVVNRRRARTPIGLALIAAIVHLMSPTTLPALPAFGAGAGPALPALGLIGPMAFVGGGGGSQAECWDYDDMEEEWVEPSSPDTTPPVVAGIYPPPGSTVEQDASFVVSVQDNSPLAYRLVLDGWAVMCQTTMGVDAVAGTVTVEFPIEYVGPNGDTMRYVLWGGSREIHLEIIDQAGNATVVGGEYEVDVPLLEQAQTDLDAARAQVLADYGADDGAPVLAWLDLFGLFGAEGGYETHATTYSRMETFMDTWDGWDGTVAGKGVFYQEDVEEIYGQVEEMMVDYNPSSPNWEVIRDKPWAPVGLLPPEGATVLLAPIIIWAIVVGVAGIIAALCSAYCPDEGKSWLCVIGSVAKIVVCAAGLSAWGRGATALAAGVESAVAGIQLLSGGIIIHGLYAGVKMCLKCIAAAFEAKCPQCSSF